MRFRPRNVGGRVVSRPTNVGLRAVEDPTDEEDEDSGEVDRRPSRSSEPDKRGRPHNGKPDQGGVSRRADAGFRGSSRITNAQLGALVAGWFVSHPDGMHDLWSRDPVGKAIKDGMKARGRWHRKGRAS